MRIDRLDASEIFVVSDSNPRVIPPTHDHYNHDQILNSFYTQNRPNEIH